MRRPWFATLAVALAATLPSMASEAAVTCNGRTPTITAAAPGVVQGTADADVIMVTGAALGQVSPTVGPVVVAAMGGDDLICLPSNAANLVIGGDGTDTVSYEASPQIVAATMNAAAVRFHVDLTEVNLVATALGLAPGVDLLPQTEILIGSPQADVLIGNVLGADLITGGAGDDIIVGLFGDDQLFGGVGNDVIVGDGYDEAVYGPIDGITVGTVTTPVLATDADLLDGGPGSDALSDDTSNNTFRGGDGNDGIAAGFGNDTIDGGTGSDEAAFVQRAAFVDLTLTTVQNTGHGMDRLTNVEDLTGGDANDTFIGTAGVNILVGGAGDDRIAGSKLASTAEDTLDGGAGTDVCHGRGRINCECPGADPRCAVAPYDWEAADGVGSPPAP